MYRKVASPSHSDHMHRFLVVPGQVVTEDLHGMFDLSRVIVNTVESHMVVGLVVVMVVEQNDASYC